MKKRYYEFYLDELLGFLTGIKNMSDEQALAILKNNTETNYWYNEYLYFVEQNCKYVLEDEQLIVSFPDGNTRIFMDLERAAYELDVPKIVVAAALNNGTEFGDGETNGMYISYWDKRKQSLMAASRLCRVVLNNEAFE